MALLNQSVQVYRQIENFLSTLREGQAPEKFTREYLKDIGFKSSNHHQFIPLLKGLGFLTSDGVPTERYREFLDQTKWKKVIAEAIRDAYSDIFVIKSRPSKSDLKLISGKYKSTYNQSEIAAERSARTFLSLLELADQDTLFGAEKMKAPSPQTGKESTENKRVPKQEDVNENKPPPNKADAIEFHYNIQIHLPATKDVEVYNAIFKSLKEHIVE